MADRHSRPALGLNPASHSAGLKIPNYGRVEPGVRLRIRPGFALSPGHRERNFWMQRPVRKIAA
jgi:hypothetical protein